MMQSENVMKQPKKEALKSLQSRMVDGVQAPLMLCKPIESMAKPLTVEKMEREAVGQIKSTKFNVSTISVSTLVESRTIYFQECFFQCLGNIIFSFCKKKDRCGMNKIPTLL